MNQQTDERLNQLFQVLAPQPAPAFPVLGMLYFLDGHYLFRHWDGEQVRSKFVTSIDLAAAFSQTEQDSGWLVAGIVRMGSNARGTWYVYSAPAQSVTISLGENDILTIPIPRTVMLGTDDAVYLWCIKDKYFDPNGRAWHAPFPNVYSDGKICWGQNTPPKADPKKAREVWSLFFGSLFNADLSTQKSNVYPTDVRPALRDLAEKKPRSYPLDDLMPAGMKISSLIENKIGGR